MGEEIVGGVVEYCFRDNGNKKYKKRILKMLMCEAMRVLKLGDIYEIREKIPPEMRTKIYEYGHLVEEITYEEACKDHGAAWVSSKEMKEKYKDSDLFCNDLGNGVLDQIGGYVLVGRMRVEHELVARTNGTTFTRPFSAGAP